MIEWKRLYKKPAGSLPGGVVTQWGVGAITVGLLIFLTYWILTGSGELEQLAEVTQATTTPPPQLYRSDDGAGGRRNHAGRHQAGGGGSSVAGAATTASQHRRGRSRTSHRPRSGPTCRAESRHRATLHRGRMGTPGALAPGSRRAAQPFASQFAYRADLPQTGRRRRIERCGAHRRRSYCNRKNRRRRKHSNKRLTPLGQSQAALKIRSRRRRRRIKSLSRRFAERPPRRKRPRLFPPRLLAAPRRRTTLLRRGSRHRKTRPVGSVSMKAHF